MNIIMFFTFFFFNSKKIHKTHHSCVSKTLTLAERKLEYYNNFQYLE